MKNKPIGIVIVQAMMSIKLFLLFILLVVIALAIFIGGDVVRLVTDYFDLTGVAFSLVMKFVKKKVLIPAFIVVISLIAIKKRIYKVLIALLILELLLALPDFSSSAWVTIQLLILIFNSNTRKYFNLESVFKRKIKM